MNNVVIVSACRTPIGALGGMFKNTTALNLSIPVMAELVKRINLNPEMIDDVIWGCNYQKTYKENNLARVAAIKAGYPVTVPGITVHRNCTSSMSSIQIGYYQIKSKEAKCIVAGGADSMSTAPYVTFDNRFGKRYGHSELRDSLWDSLTNLGIGPAMGITAENIAEKYNVTREEQDEYAFLSQKRAVAAIESGKFQEEIVQVETSEKKSKIICSVDEYPKKNISLEKLSNLKAVFKTNGTVTAGNSSGMNDASSGVMLMDENTAKKLNIPILSKIVSVATSGVDPDYMGIGPIYATEQALKKANLSIEDIGLFEINEAFAAQCIACERELGIDRNILNVNGGGISLGHPVGATGSRIVVTLLYEMKRKNIRYGLATLCAGGGMGTAIIIENTNYHTL